MVKTTFLKANQVGIVKIKVNLYLFSAKMSFACKSMISCLNWEDSLLGIKESSNMII